jgi:hypothetical protein
MAEKITKAELIAFLDGLVADLKKDPMFNDDILACSRHFVLTARDADGRVLCGVVVLFGDVDENEAMLARMEDGDD